MKFTCEECGSEIKAPPSARRVVCSAQCGKLRKSRLFRGPNHPRWTGGRPKSTKPKINNFEFIKSRYVTVLDNGCWQWNGAVGAGGYGRLSCAGRQYAAHRYFHEHKHGPIPKKIILDHKCHDPEFCKGGKDCPHRRCVNPDHTEHSTHKKNNNPSRSNINNSKSLESIKARTHCKYGHEFTPENTAIYKNSNVTKNGEPIFSRHCKECNRLRQDTQWLAQRGKTRKRYTPTVKKLNDSQIRSLREQYASRVKSQSELLAEFGLTTGVLLEVVRGNCRIEAGGPIWDKNRRYTKINGDLD